MLTGLQCYSMRKVLPWMAHKLRYVQMQLITQYAQTN